MSSFSGQTLVFVAIGFTVGYLLRDNAASRFLKKSIMDIINKFKKK